MSRTLRSLLLGSVALVGTGATGALAQNISNEVWLGQLGGTNTITIDQNGRNNLAGADNVAHLLNQDGDGNLLDIEQFGHRNSIGAEAWDDDDAALRPTGINQIGSRNSATVEQRTGENAFDGSNTVGAIYQYSAYGLTYATNTLSIVQTGEGASGHRVDTVRQIHVGAGGENKAAITQTGGGPNEGNSLGDLFQWGSANEFTLNQGEHSNEVSDVRQVGRDNWSWVEQDGGSGNRLQYLQQWGYGNRAKVEMDGSFNVVERVYQFNTNLGSSAHGNSAKITIHGEGNGAANGDTGQFGVQAVDDVGAPQGNTVQIGDANHARITIAGEGNMFGAQQFGDGNFAAISIGLYVDPVAGFVAPGGIANESAVFQRGDDNFLSHKALGDRNAAAVQQFGSSNWLSIVQVNGGGLSGDVRGNLAQVSIRGNRNNELDYFTGIASDAALTAPGLRPGKLYQEGLGNVAVTKVTGSDNRFGFHQVGNGNSAEATIVGSGNQVVVVQLGSDNVSVTEQYGSGNIAVVLQ